MPMTVITVTNAPASLRGDLTKWMQEIAVGVYIGNFNARIRDNLWQRVIESVGKGQATISYAYRNEIGYQFDTYRTQRENVNYDGIPLVLLPLEQKANMDDLSKGFSNAAKFRRSKKFSSPKRDDSVRQSNYVVVDIETDGLHEFHNKIIEVAALKVVGNKKSSFRRLITYNDILPKDIIQLTGITDELLQKNGVPIEDALEEFRIFIGDSIITGYSVDFDIRFINQYLTSLGYPKLTNKSVDLLRFIKKKNMFLSSYRLEDVLMSYGIDKDVEHRAMSDVLVIHELAVKVNGFMDSLN